MSHSSTLLGSAAFDQAVKLAKTQGNKRNLTRGKELKVEDLVLKRCWLARYWGLAAKLGVCPNIAHQKHAGWAAVAPFPLKVVVSAGEKATALATGEGLQLSNTKSDKFAADESSGDALSGDWDGFEQEEIPLLANNKDGGINDQLQAVDKALQELAKLKVEEAVLLKISREQNPTLMWLGLSMEQAQDIHFKQAWLVYFFWRQAQGAGIEEDVSKERLLYWINRINKPPRYQDAVDVHRGLSELRNLGIDYHNKLH